MHSPDQLLEIAAQCRGVLHRPLAVRRPQSERIAPDIVNFSVGRCRPAVEHGKHGFDGRESGARRIAGGCGLFSSLDSFPILEINDPAPALGQHWTQRRAACGAAAFAKVLENDLGGGLPVDLIGADDA